MNNSGASMDSADITQRFALDTQGFEAMKQAAQKSPAGGAKAVAKQFDAMFMQMMLKSMRDATPANGPLDSNGGKMYTSMLDQQLAQQLSSRGIGLADQLLGQLTRNGGGAKGATASTAGASGQSLPLQGAHASARTLGGRAFNANAMPTAGGLRSASRSPHARAFVDKLSSAAASASQATGIPARMLLGQAALESGWGRREVSRADGSTSYNVMGVKAGKNWTGPTVDATTTEYHNGVAQKVTAKFRAYGSYQEAMTDYANLLKNNPRYAPVMQTAQDPTGFAQGLQKAGYATDPHYASKLISIMKQLA